jgi:hypothetical protein
MNWRAIGEVQGTLSVWGDIGQMIQRIPLSGGQSQGRIAAVFDSDFVISLLSRRQADINFLDACAGADHHFNGFATAVRNDNL